jgi:hypothetical protein
MYILRLNFNSGSHSHRATRKKSNSGKFIVGQISLEFFEKLEGLNENL